jgi:dCTP deaminase
MILSNREILKALDEKRLVIEPNPSPRKPTKDQDCPYNTHSVDLRLSNEIIVPQKGAFAYDLTQDANLATLISNTSQQFTITEMQPYHLKPNQFILAQTFERIELPIGNSSPCLAARIEGKSSRARCGILIHFTAPTVHPGFTGNLTLEIINLGPATFILKPKMPIAQLIVEQIQGDLFENPSQFQNQTSPEGLIR